MEKLYTVHIVAPLASISLLQEPNRMNRQDLVRHYIKVGKIKSVSRNSIKPENVFNREKGNNSSETSITLSLIEYSHLRERI